MTLRRLAFNSLLGALVGLVALAAVALWAWHSVSSRIQQLDELSGLHQKTHQLRTAIDYTTQFRADPALLRALATDARDLAASAEATGAVGARRATQHLREIAWIADELAGIAARETIDSDRGAAMVDVWRQLQIHETAVSETLEEIIEAGHRGILDTLTAALGTLLLTGAILALLGLIAFLRLHHRVSRPVARIERAMRDMASGNAASRIMLDSQDELGELARTFNAMAEQRQRHEADLKESEARFRQITESIGEVFWMTPPDMQDLIYVSPAFESIWGLSRESLYENSQLWVDAIHPDDRDHVVAGLGRDDLENLAMEYRIVRPDGQVRWIEDQSFPVRAADGSLARIVGVARDVTERKQAQVELRERIKELRCLYRVLELTTERERSVESACTEIALLLPRYLLHDHDAVAFIELDERRYTSADWSKPQASLTRPVEVGGVPVGRVQVGYRSSWPDAPGDQGPFLSEEVTLLAGVATHLGRMIEARGLTDSLAQTERLKAVGELTGGIAHDFNNLLTVILGNAELMEDHLQTPRQRETLAMIVRAAERGAELTQRLLAFARRQALEPRAVDVNALLSDIHGLLRHSLGPAVEMRVETEPDLPAALVDPGQLENALLNLCLNARDAGGGQVILETGRRRGMLEQSEGVTETQPHDYAMIAVSDNGCGMTAEVLRRAFEPFFSTKSREKGTGLGLSMVYGFVRQSGGQVHIHSTPGVGTRVELRLPLAEPEARS